MFFDSPGFGSSALCGGTACTKRFTSGPMFWLNHQNFLLSRSAPKMWILTSSPKDDDWRKPRIAHAASWIDSLRLTTVLAAESCWLNFCWLRGDLWMNYMSFVMLYDAVWCCMMLYADIRMVPLRMPFLLLDAMMCDGTVIQGGLLFHFVSRKRQSLLNYPNSRV